MRTFAGILLALVFASAPATAQIVVLDPGHGGRDSGAVGCGLEEEDVVLDVSLRAATLLRGAGLTVHLTRSDDRFIELSARASFANSRGANRFVSVHANANSGTPASGTETFVYTRASSTSRTMGQQIQDELIATWGLRNRGLKTANFSVIRRTSMPAALAELAFINRCNPDAGLLGSPGERGRIAAALARSVLASLGRTGPVDPPDEPVDPPVEPPSAATGRILGVSFEDIGVGLEDTSTRIAGATVHVNGETQVSNAEGSFAFTLAPGSYRIEVSKDGFVSAGRDCVVRAGADAWCSVGLSTIRAETTRVRGVVYEENGSSVMSAPRIAGATVELGGSFTTTDAGGNFSFDIAPGNVTLRVSKDGFAQAVRSCTASGSETWCSVGLVSSSRVGAMQGVVFVDGHLSSRIEGAIVRIRELGTNVRSASRSGYWRFEVPAGTYTIDIEAPGYVSTSESCVVREGGEAWCSAGLSTIGSGGSFVVDEREPEEAALDGNDPSAISGGCSASGSGTSNLWLLGLLGLMLFRRRRTALSALLAVSVVGLAGCSESPDVAAAYQSLIEAPERGELMLASQVPSFAQLENVMEIAQGDFIDLELSPDATHLALSHACYAALSVLSLETRELRVLREAPQAGYEPRWREDSQVLGVRTEGQTSTAAPMLAFSVDGSEATPFQPANTLSVRIVDDAVVMRTQDGDETRLGPPGDRYFEPRASDDGEFVTFRGLSTGLYIHRRADGATFMVGTGSHARFDASSRLMVFERATSDGHERISSVLFVMDLTSDELRYGPIETDLVRPDAPSIGNGRLAFMDEGSAMIGELRIQN